MVELDNALDKFSNAFKDLPNLKRYIDGVVKPYSKSGSNFEYYKEFMRCIGDDYTLYQCLCGFVACSFISVDNRFTISFYNKRIDKFLSLENTVEYDAESVDFEIFEIFD